ncbi:MAG: DNA polymerase III subunit beta [Lachnospiraceae bacterium]|jgi:DNA polymerase-3 subunit beta
MKIRCLKADILNGLNIAMRAVPSKTTLPILESFLIIADEEIRIITNDRDMGIETGIIGGIEDKGKIAVDAKIFNEIIRKFPENEVTIETDDNLRIRIKCEESEFTLLGRNPKEFPELPYTEEKEKVVISQFVLKELIRQTIFSISTGDTNSIMKGELFEVSGNNLRMISLDSHRISIRREKLSDSYNDFKVIVPGKTLNELSRILSGEKDEKVEISFDKNFIKFEFNKTKVISRLIEGEFFNIDQMISSDYETEIRINKNDFFNCADRAFTLTKEVEKKPLILDIRDNEIKMDVTTSLGSMNARLPISKFGKDLFIGFNPKFFIEALKVIDDEEISIYFVNSTAPCIIKNQEGEYIYIILPVNISR